MDTWPELHREVDRLDLGERRARAERAAFESWGSVAEARVLADIARVARSRANELFTETGVVVFVSTTDVGVRGGSGTPRIRAISLALGTTRVDVYSARAPYESPNVHLGVSRASTTARHPVFAPVPGCVVVRGESGEPALLDVSAGPASERTATTVDALVLRAFALLVGAHRPLRAA